MKELSRGEEEEKVTKEGVNNSLLAIVLTSRPEMETVNNPTTLSPTSTFNANPTTETSSTINPVSKIEISRQHFVTTDIFEPSIFSVCMGVNISEREVQ
jgi:hypothetical protein